MAGITVHPVTLRWAVKTSGADPAAVASKKGLAELPTWLSGDEPLRLSFSRLSELGKALHMPFGSLVRSVVPEADEDELIRYRTIGNREVEPSRNLLDVIRLMRNRQDWAKDERSAIGLGENRLVGSVSSSASAQELSQAIRKGLQLDDMWPLHKSAEERFRYVRQHASANGMLVMVDSTVGTSHRRLEVEEFRAFVLLDKTAPLIFINRNDSFPAMLFSLLHEIGHVLLGREEIFNDSDSAMSESRIERLINQAVVQAVVDDGDFRRRWVSAKHKSAHVPTVADECAKLYGLSAVALTIHAKRLGLATDDDVQAVMDESRKHVEAKHAAGAQGGNQNSTNAFHLDSGFVELVKNGVDRGDLGYSDAFSLLGVKSIHAYDGLLRAKGLAE